MILLTIASLSLGAASPTQRPRNPTTQIAGLVGKKTKWVELPQQVQVEGDYSPTVGRAPEPPPGPWGRVRYLTPEERAQPIIVSPAPKLVYVDEQQETDKATGGSKPPKADDGDVDIPEYVTSKPTTNISTVGQVEGYAPPGSATGSTAIPDYSAPK